MKGRWRLVASGVLLAGFIALVLWLQYAPIESDPVELPPPPQAAASGTPPPVAPSPRRGPPPGTPAPLPPAAPAPGPAPEGPSGLALFPPPGTDPIKRGIIVPEGFELPPGYVRHYQSTDDGTQLPAILMFHPDHAPKDASGNPVPMPPGRIVPPELAPRGLPIQYLEPPGAERGD